MQELAEIHHLKICLDLLENLIVQIRKIHLIKKGLNMQIITHPLQQIWVIIPTEWDSQMIKSSQSQFLISKTKIVNHLITKNSFQVVFSKIIHLQDWEMKMMKNTINSKIRKDKSLRYLTKFLMLLSWVMTFIWISLTGVNLTI